MSDSRGLTLLVLASALLHLALLYGVRWQAQTVRLEPPASFRQSVQLRLRESRTETPPTPRSAVVPAPPQSTPAAPGRQPTPHPTSRTRPATEAAAPANSAAPAADSATPSTAVITRQSDQAAATDKDFSVPQASTSDSLPEDVVGNAKRGIGKIDRQLRAEVAGPARAALLGKEGPTKLARDIANAGVEHGVTLKTIYGPDGQQFTKYSGPFGSYCIWVPKNEIAATRGTTFENKSRVTTCPRE